MFKKFTNRLKNAPACFDDLKEEQEQVKKLEKKHINEG